MKRFLSLSLAFLMLLLCSCRVFNGDDGSSVIYYYEYTSEVVYTESSSSDISTAGQSDDTEQALSVPQQAASDYVADTDSTAESQAVIITDTAPDTVQEIVEADVNTTGEKPLYYTYLTNAQQRIYRFMKSAAEQMTTGFFSIGATHSGEDRFSDIAIAYRALSADNPQIFWLPDVYVMSSDGSAIAFSDKESEIDYPFTPQQKKMAQQRLDTMVSYLTERANALDSRFEKELFFHDWLCNNVTYRDDGTNSVFTVYGALINGVAVCEGYSRAMQLLCDSVGIPCTVVYGNSNGVGHMWNIIDPGDGWYHLDVTWDDDEKYNYVRHTYFNLTDEKILADHQIFEVVQAGQTYEGTDCFNLYIYTCSGQKYNYFIKNELVFSDDAAALAQVIKNAADNGASSIEILYNGAQDYIDFLNQVNRALSKGGPDVQINAYSYLGGCTVLWW